MKIVTSNIYNELVNYSFFIKQYEENYESLYTSLLELHNYWSDEKAEIFNKHVIENKSNIETTKDELNTLKNIYKYIYDSYSKIGNKIYFEEKNFSSLNSKFESCVLQAEEIFKKYDSMVNIQGDKTLMNQYEKYKEVLDLLLEVRSKVNDTIKLIYETENGVKMMLSRINVDIIKESDANEFL